MVCNSLSKFFKTSPYSSSLCSNLDAYSVKSWFRLSSAFSSAFALSNFCLISASRLFFSTSRLSSKSFMLISVSNDYQQLEMRKIKFLLLSSRKQYHVQAIHDQLAFTFQAKTFRDSATEVTTRLCCFSSDLLCSFNQIITISNCWRLSADSTSVHAGTS